MADNSPKKWFKLEESFFSKVDQKLLDDLREQAATEERAASIQRLTGITDPKVCHDIAALNISAESLAALRLVPLVAVAWADDRIEDNERFRVIHAAEKAGLQPNEPAYEMLKGWLTVRPSTELFDTWVQYAQSLSQSLDQTSRKELSKSMVAQVQSVAAANGGLFGYGSISPTEQKLLDRVAAALA